MPSRPVKSTKSQILIVPEPHAKSIALPAFGRPASSLSFSIISIVPPRHGEGCQSLTA